MGWDYLSIPKLQRWNPYFHPTLYWASDYLFMLKFKLMYVGKRGPRGAATKAPSANFSVDSVCVPLTLF